jgi:hypothetical protein
MVTKALGLLLFIVALIWAFGFVWLHLTMTGFTDPVLPLPLHLALGFAGPFALVVGSTLLMALWHPRLGAIIALLACTWLTWQLAPDCLMGVIEPRRPLQAPKPYVALFTVLAFVAIADIGAVAAFRRVRKTI